MLKQMKLHEELAHDVQAAGIIVKEIDMTDMGIEGLYYFSPPMTHPVITLNSKITSMPERNIVLAYNIGLYRYCSGNVFAYPLVLQSECDQQARHFAVHRCMPVFKLIRAFRVGVDSLAELSIYLEIPLKELLYGIALYAAEAGPTLRYGQYTVTWNPFNIELSRQIGRDCL